MSIIDFEEEEKKHKVEYPKFRIIQGGKEPPEHNDCWLKNFEEHGVFIARDTKNGTSWIASQCEVKAKAGNAYLLIFTQWDPEKGRPREHISWVDAITFSKDWHCVEVLTDGKNYPEIEDGESNWTDHEEGLEGDVGISTDSTVDQDTGQEVVSRESDAEPKNIK